MKRLAVFWVVTGFLHAGCNNDAGPESTQGLERKAASKYSAPEAITEDGLIVFNKSAGDTGPPSRVTLDRWWEEVQRCVEMESEPPNIIITDNIRNTCPNSEGSQGAYCSINDNWYVVILSDRLTWAWLWKHEFMHHIFRLNDKAEYKYHEPDWLWQCQYN